MSARNSPVVHWRMLLAELAHPTASVCCFTRSKFLIPQSGLQCSHAPAPAGSLRRPTARRVAGCGTDHPQRPRRPAPPVRPRHHAPRRRPARHFRRPARHPATGTAPRAVRLPVPWRPRRLLRRPERRHLRHVHRPHRTAARGAHLGRRPPCGPITRAPREGSPSRRFTPGCRAPRTSPFTHPFWVL